MSNFEKEFLANYLKFGLGSMPKSDIDALVMHLIDEYGIDEGQPMKKSSNQSASEKLKTPISKIKKLRYDAALKFGGDVEESAKLKLLISLSKATFDSKGEKICLIIEDALAKNWLQGQLKNHQHFFDNSFNSEIIKVSASGFIDVIEKVFESDEIQSFKNEYEGAKALENADARKSALKSFAVNLALKISEKAGDHIASGLLTYLN